MADLSPPSPSASSSSFILLLFLLPFVQTSIDAVKYALKIHPKGVGPDSNYYIVDAGSRLELSCELDVDGHAGVADHLEGLDWMRGSLRVEPTWLSVFTQPKMDEKRRMPRQGLIVPNVDEKVAGEYRCVYFDEVERRVHVRVLAKINWRLKDDSPAGSIGQPFTIDCGAEGVDNSAIKIMDQHGQAIEESNIAGLGKALYLAGPELTIPKLGKEHQDFKIRCVAIQTVILDEEKSISTIHTNERELTIHVWQPPQFVELANGGQFFALPGVTVALRWTVRSSNPPVRNFTLKRNNEIIDIAGAKTQQQRYIVEAEGNMLTLKISEVQEEDYGRYTCIAYNGKLAGEQSALLDIPKPPKQPRVWLENVTNVSISWHLEEQREEGQLPVSYFWIIYKPLRRRVQQKASTDWTFEDLDMDSDFLSESQQDSKKDNNNNNNIRMFGGGWEVLPQNASSTYRLRRRKNPANVYDIAGLDPFTEYLFSFVAGNPTGESDPLERKQETVEGWSPPADEVARHAELASSSAAFSAKIVGGFSVFLIFLLVCCFGCCIICHDVDDE